jgi:hypothetical protein
MKKVIAIVFILLSWRVQAQTDSVSTDNDLFDMSLEDLLKLDLVDRNFYLYGYINSNLQKTFDYPTRANDGSTRKVSDPGEWTPVRNFHIYGRGNLTSKISYLFNLARNGESIEIRNAWGNFAFKDALQVRVGKMYRRFGLYNERLDQIPTFIGIEAPEMLDPDHLFLPRTTDLMIHGRFQNSSRVISYALMTENAEGGSTKNVIPAGWDLRYKSFTNSFIIGVSGYASSMSNNKSTSSVALGKGAPAGGILPWMDGDRYSIIGVFFEKQIGNLLIQSEYYNASHHAIRNADAVLEIVKNANINEDQRSRFLGSNARTPSDILVADDVQRKANYHVQTWYVRFGYNIQTDVGQFVPYLFLDWMSYPEVIQNKTYGGDDEAGLADNGKFFKPSLGVAYRPIPNVAIKFDGSYHSQQFNGKQVNYPELRLDFSFAFSNNQLSKALGDN